VEGDVNLFTDERRSPVAVSKPIAVRLPLELENRLSQLSKTTGRSASYYIRDLIVRHLEELEEEAWAEAAIQDWVKSGKKSRPAQELWDELGI
jgi:RHH-type rel operon transcriptional repressor/antitoxin RelB